MAEESAALQKVREYRSRRGAEEGEDGDEWEEDAKLLVEAIKGGELDVVKYLVEEEAPVEMGDEEEWTPLHHAAYQGHVEISRILLERGVNIEASTGDEGDHPLHLAAVNGHRALVELLLEQGAFADAEDELGNRPLHRAAGRLHLSVVQCLLQQRAGSIDVNAPDCNVDTALHLAAGAAHVQEGDEVDDERVLEVVRLLVEEGEADPLLRNRFEKRASDLAKGRGLAVVERYLLQAENVAEMQKQA